MNKKLLKRTISATFAALAIAAVGAEQALPTPPPSPYPDTESSVNVAVTNWPSLGRRVKLTLSANFSPSNCVQVALGQNTDSNGDLAPEETMLCIGVDCGEPFMVGADVLGRPQPYSNGISFDDGCDVPGGHALPTNITIYTFSFKQPSDVSRRYTHAKVITRGRGNSAAEIAAKITRPGAALILR